MKKLCFPPRWMWVCMVFLVIDFSSRQLYLLVKPKSKASVILQETRSLPAPIKHAPPNDPRFLGSAEDGTHPYYHHGLAASHQEESVWRGRKFTTFTNRLGFRDARIRDVSLKKNRPRIIFMGDSNIYGVGLDWDQTIAGMLGQRFPALEILNAAVPSYCPTIEEAKLRYLMGLHGLETDIVILFLDVADIDDELSFGRNSDGSVFLEGPQFSELPENKNWADSLEKGLQHSVERNFTVVGALIRNVRQWLRRHCSWFGVMAYEKGRWPEYDGHLNTRIEEGILRATSSLTRLHEFLKSKNTRLILVVSPGSSQMDNLDPRSRALTVWESWGRANHVPILSLFPLFYSHASDYADLTQSSGHWNEKGHELVAVELSQRLRTVLPGIFSGP